MTLDASVCRSEYYLGLKKKAKIYHDPIFGYLNRWNPSTKFEKKELFSSRLAGVNAQTPRHAKMKILIDIIKRACKRLNIDPKDLCDDPDSSAQSKSSSREPAEGDENWDELS